MMPASGKWAMAPGAAPETRRVLLVGPYGLGNLITAIPAIRSLKESGFRVDIACLLKTTEEVCRTIAPLSDWFGTVYALHRGQGWRALAATAAQIRRQRYDASVLLLPSMRPVYHLVHRVLGAKLRIAGQYPGQPWHHLLFLNHRLVPIQLGLHDAQQTQRLVNQGLGLIRPLPGSYVFRSVPKVPGLIGFHPGCKQTDSFKRWDLRYFWGVIDRIAKTWPQARFRIFFGPDELDQRKQFEDWIAVIGSGDIKDRVEIPRARTMSDLFTLVGECGVMIANDSGVMHVAASQGSICAGIFGPTDAVRTGPFSPQSRVLGFPMSCQPCALTNDPAKRVFHCVHSEQFCMTRIYPHDVVDWFTEWALPRLKAAGGFQDNLSAATHSQ